MKALLNRREVGQACKVPCLQECVPIIAKEVK